MTDARFCMELSIYSELNDFETALGVSPGSVYGMFGLDAIAPENLKRIESTASKNLCKSLPSFTDCYQDALKEISAFFLSEEQGDHSWHYAFVSKVPLAIERYSDIQQLFLLRSLIRLHPNEAPIIFCADKKLARLLEAVFLGKHAPEKQNMPGIRAWARFIRTLLRVAFNHAKSTNPDLLIFSLSVGPPASNTDTYFGNLPSIAGATTPTELVYLSAGRAIRLPMGKGITPLEAIVECSDVLSAWRSSLVGCSINKKTIFTNESVTEFKVIAHYIKQLEIKSGEFFYHHFLENAFRRLFAKLTPRVVLYPFENRSWEKLLLLEARKQGIRHCVAYQHSSITPRHLAFNIEDGEIPENCLPSSIITAGEVTYHWLAKTAPALSAVIHKGVSLRRVRADITQTGKEGILVAISSSRNEAWNILRIVNAAAHITTIPMIIRPHPTLKIADIYDAFEWPSHVMLSTNRSLIADITDCSLVAYSSSTVALEAMLYGRFPIFIDIGDIPSGDPIAHEAGFKFRVSKGQELAETCRLLSTLPLPDKAEMQSEARNYAERYLIEPTPESLSGMTQRLINPGVSE